ncbi:DUF3073 domain-containing protein [Leifsonia sp. NPDC056665]|uniref:DUF3073 domain-containing protein n=1 Tax=unclassified Leifsonia TaxID=2663824 RepID=UPI0036835DDD
MGRGRQKAKHTKIARQLKSFSPNVNYDALERELTGHSHHDDEHNYDAWADYNPDGDDDTPGYDDADEDEYEDSESETPKRA